MCSQPNKLTNNEQSTNQDAYADNGAIPLEDAMQAMSLIFQYVDQQCLARELGVSKSTLIRWREKYCPMEARRQLPI